jgi:hypothetical protein
VSEEKSLELRVSVDVGYRRHSVAMGLSSGEVLEEFGSAQGEFTSSNRKIHKNQKPDPVTHYWK